VPSEVLSKPELLQNAVDPPADFAGDHIQAVVLEVLKKLVHLVHRFVDIDTSEAGLVTGCRRFSSKCTTTTPTRATLSANMWPAA